MVKKGFTLIELILVIAIIGILAVGLLATVNPSKQAQKAFDTRKKTDLATLQRALEGYYADNNGVYPESSDYKIKPSKTVVLNWGDAWQPYTDRLPKEPRTGKNYVYVVSQDRQTYGLYASLERDDDPQKCVLDVTGACANLSAKFSVSTTDKLSACGGGKCTFGVTSSDTQP